MRRWILWPGVMVAMFVTCAVPTASTGKQSTLQVQASELWIHVEASGARADMDLNMPVALVEAALAIAPDAVVSQGQLQLGAGYELPVSTIRHLWRALSGTTSPAEPVTVRYGSRQVRIARSADTILVSILDQQFSEELRIEIPLSVVDALLSGEGDELNIRAALEELSMLDGAVVQVVEPDSNIRVWIDDNPVR